MPAILKAAREAGATAAGFTVVRLPYANAPLFEKWLETHFPDRKDKVLNRIKAMRGGKMYDAQWGKRMRGEGIFADQIAAMFDVARRKAGFTDDGRELAPPRRSAVPAARSSSCFKTPCKIWLKIFCNSCGTNAGSPTTRPGPTPRCSGNSPTGRKNKISPTGSRSSRGT
jgi:hypothetical protein